MDYYKTLGVDRNASPEEIKKAYRKLASQHHPDKGGDTSTFQKIEEAYRVLSDPKQKHQYDHPQSQKFNGFPGGFSFNVNGFDINDFFGSMFGQTAQAHSPFHTRNSNLFRTAITITLKDSYYGSSQQVKLQTPLGLKFVTIEIPKGIKNGDQMRFDNVLENSVLIVEFRIMPDLKFERRGDDLYAVQSVSVLDLIAGNTFQFTTFSGKTLEVAIKPKTQPNMQLKLQGQGMPVYGTPLYGDQIIVLNCYVPDTIDESITQSILQARAK